MLAGAPASIQGRNIDPSESQRWDCSKSCGSKTGFDSTDNMVKSVGNGSRDNKRDTSLSVTTCLRDSNQL